MTEMTIDKGIIIDDVESVLFGIRDLCGEVVTDIGVVKRFITREKNTKFYIDCNLNSSMQQQNNCVYIWIDTGFTSYNGDPILVSLLKRYGSFTGHVVGTIRSLAESARRFFKLNRNVADKKIDAFKKKYAGKADERRIKHILDERQYLLQSVNDCGDHSVLAERMIAAEIPEMISVSEDSQETVSDNVCGGNGQTVESELSDYEKEITVGLLLEKMEGMQKYMDELVATLQKVSCESKAKIQELQEKNAEYRRVILQMREFAGYVPEEPNSTRFKNENPSGHELLGRHGKILVIGGQELGVNVMHGIAKKLGFEKDDFDFVDYDKAKDFADRIRKNGKYSAVIIGACPHKAAGNAGYTSTVEKLKGLDGMPFTTDARSKSGKLKVTKESFREALSGVCANLRVGYAC